MRLPSNPWLGSRGSQAALPGHNVGQVDDPA
jgi:hypothetical protein